MNRFTTEDLKYSDLGSDTDIVLDFLTLEKLLIPFYPRVYLQHHFLLLISISVFHHQPNFLLLIFVPVFHQ